ncbi:low affinity iron permease family protein [Mycolicibacterium mucogenicum]|jgi:low affinity Fe/Cu permease|uniref:low affinity iron permease family protein n=1 Tax=Mycolicibacterium TaxID=1866885 RepID=UPI00226A8D1B|nr:MULTISPECIES: low affinity iron permease family protein [Mycolicibacterium]MCX8561668.1 low affinity iron permease family protein [Mycolicibacterium mucogenicum]
MTASDNPDPDVMPSGASEKLSPFDRFATSTAEIVSRAWFFLACVLLVIVWAPTFALMTVDTWQLVINTITTIITFLLVALLQNTQRRADEALQHKLNAIADALADLMHHQGRENEGIREDEKQLREAVGLEDREGTG